MTIYYILLLAFIGTNLYHSWHVHNLEKDIEILKDQYFTWVTLENDDWNGK